MLQTTEHGLIEKFSELDGWAGLRRNFAIAMCTTLRRNPFRGSTRLRRYISGALVPPLNSPVRCVLPDGYSIVVEPAALTCECIERTVYNQGTYEEGTLDVLRRCLNEGDVFFDVGANIGLMTLLAAQRVGESGAVHAFEPNPEVAGVLRRNVAINAFKNVHVHEHALGSHESTEVLYGNREISVGSASLIKPEHTDDPGVQVNVSTLDTFISTHGIPPIKMMKIDVEGWEYEVLRGGERLLKSPDAPILCFEYSNTHPVHGGTLSDLYSFVVESNSYRVFKLQRGKEVASPLVEIKTHSELPNHDNIFCFPPNHPPID
jgi:FkbM family methyltransferase